MTIPSFRFLLPPAFLTAALVSCENPADTTSTAEVAETQTALSGSGTRYELTEASTIEFTGSKVTGSHDGGFKEFTGFFTLTEGSTVPSSGEITIDMQSVYSDNEKLTEHLKSADFFEVDQYPTATFTMTEVSQTGDQDFRVSGNFELHGVTKNITFPATAGLEGGVASIEAEFDINRKDFDIVYAGKADDLIRDEVVIRFDLEAKASGQ